MATFRQLNFSFIVSIKTFSLSFLPFMLPALPLIAVALEATDMKIKVFILMAKIGSLLDKIFLIFFGDIISHKKILMTAFFIFSCAALFTFFVPDASLFVFSGFLFGLGTGTIISLSNVCIKLIYKNDSLTETYLSGSGAISNFVTVLAIIAGGYIADYVGWRYNILTLLCIALILLLWVIISTFPVRSTVVNIKTGMKEKTEFREFYALIKDMKFVSLASLFSLLQAAHMVLLVILPFLFIRHMHFSAHICGVILSSTYLFYVLGELACARYHSRISEKVLLAIGFVSMFLMIVLFYGVYIDSIRYQKVGLILLGLVIFSFGSGMLSPHIQSRIMNLYPRIVGAAVGLMGLFNSILLTAALLVAVILSDSQILSLTIFQGGTFGLLLIALVIYVMNPKPTAV